MLYSRRMKLAAAISGLAAMGAMATVALASPGSMFFPTNFVTARLDETIQINNDRVKFQTKGPTNVRMQKIDFDPGGYTGWHHHPGLVVVVVESGTLVLTDANCGSRTYGPGAPNGAVFIEGDEHSHIASSPGGATIYVTYVVPAASPPVFRIEDDVPSCAAP